MSDSVIEVNGTGIAAPKPSLGVRVFQNTAAQLAGRVIGIFLSAGTSILVARYLGKEKLGESAGDCGSGGGAAGEAAIDGNAAGCDRYVVGNRGCGSSATSAETGRRVAMGNISDRVDDLPRATFGCADDQQDFSDGFDGAGISVAAEMVLREAAVAGGAEVVQESLSECGASAGICEGRAS